MAIGAPTQSKSAQGTTVTANAAITFNSTPATNSLIVVCCASYLSSSTDIWATGTCADNKTNTYARLTSLEHTDGHSAMFWGVALASSATFTVTVTPTSSAYITVAIHEFPGVTRISPNDGSNTGGAVNNAPTTGSVTPSQADALLVGTMSHVSSTEALGTGANYTQMQEIESASSGQPINTQYRIVNSIAAYTSVWSAADGATDWTCVISAFKAAPVGIPPGLIRPVWRNVTRRVYR